MYTANKMVYSIVVLVICIAVGMVEPHGYLKDPPARGSMWTQGWDTPKNYDHNQLFCGGRQVRNPRKVMRIRGG
jgi:hypothetical protein